MPNNPALTVQKIFPWVFVLVLGIIGGLGLSVAPADASASGQYFPLWSRLAVSGTLLVAALFLWSRSRPDRPCGPYSRETGYFRTRAEADAELRAWRQGSRSSARR